MKLQGTLEFRDLGAGQWILKTTKGEVALFGEIDADMAGSSVEIEGSAVEGMSSAMAARSAVMVESVRKR